MKISYDKLFKILKERKITKARLCREAGIYKSEMRAIECCQPLELSSLMQICDYLDCDVFDILETDDQKKSEDLPCVYLT
ncbi:MAG: helix-turn-helix transcriptional regulator [Clostridia bacterium]|nr:helix-turn-helix transcriptional regulator [Clostridia bacterium]